MMPAGRVPRSDRVLFAAVLRRMVLVAPITGLSAALPLPSPVDWTAVALCLVAYVSGQCLLVVVDRRPDTFRSNVTYHVAIVLHYTAVTFAVLAARVPAPPLVLLYALGVGFAVVTTRRLYHQLFSWFCGGVSYALALAAMHVPVGTIAAYSWLLLGLTMLLLLVLRFLVEFAHSSAARSEAYAELARLTTDAEDLDDAVHRCAPGIAALCSAEDVRLVRGEPPAVGAVVLPLGHDGTAACWLVLVGGRNEESATLAADLLRSVARRDAGRTELHRLSSTDPLTGVANRRGMAARLEEPVDGEAGPTTLCLVLADLDRFKAYNDEHGHQAGDDLLARFARALADVTTGDDLVVRLGGDEFCVLVRGSEADGQRYLQRLRNRWLTEPGPRVAYSTGLATCSGADGFDAAHQQADAALYRAKHAAPLPMGLPASSPRLR